MKYLRTIGSVSTIWTWPYCWGTGSRCGLWVSWPRCVPKRATAGASYKTDSEPPVEGHIGRDSHKQAQGAPWAGGLCFLITVGIIRATLLEFVVFRTQMQIKELTEHATTLLLGLSQGGKNRGRFNGGKSVIIWKRNWKSPQEHKENTRKHQMCRNPDKLLWNVGVSLHYLNI